MAARREVRLDRTLGPLVVEWIETNLVHGPGDVQGQPVELDDEQVRFILGCYELDDHGRRVVRRAVFSRPKGRAKSELAAMLVCAEALGPARFAGWDHDGRPLGHSVTGPVVLCAATEESQAGIVYEAAQFMLREGAVSSTPGLDVGLTRTFLPGGGRIQAVTAKAPSKDGGKETFSVFDETHLYVSEQLHRMHETMRRNSGKRKAAQPWTLETSTMYAPGEGSVAEQSHAYALAVTAGKLTDRGFLFDHRDGGLPVDFDDDDQLRACLTQAYGAAAEWMDLDRLIHEARDPQTGASDFKRYFLNVATRREEDLFIPSRVWDALIDPELDVGDGRPTAYVGADGSRTHDCTVVAIAIPREDGTIAVDARIFSVRKHVAHHELHEGGTIDFDSVEAFIADLFDLFDVKEVAYDPRFLERSMEIASTRLPEGAVFPVEPSSKHARDAYQCLFTAAVDGKIRHRGDPAIAAHLANCAVDRREAGNEIRRLRKIDRNLPIDAVPALALATWRAMNPAETDIWLSIA